MDRLPVTSSNIRSVGYDSQRQLLHVEYLNGGVYEYTGVPQEKYDEMLKADSVGKFMHTNIKGLHDFTKLDQDE